MPVRVLSVRLLSILALTAVAVALPVATAGSAPKQGKTFAVEAEAPAWAGATDPAYTVKITNTTGTQQLGSANVTIPTAGAADIDFTVTSEPVFSGTTAPGATVARPGGGKVIELRNLVLAPNSSVTIALGLRLPCVAKAYRWQVDARQSNDFSGTPGNTLGPVTGTPDTIVQGSCKLRFVNEPASAEVGAEITADAFGPGSPNPVTVEAIDGSPAPQRLTWFEDDVELEATGGPGSLSASSPATAGLASFDNLLSIGLAGNYNLIASPATAPGFSNDVSNDFQIIDVVEPCNGSNCTASLSGNRTSSTLTGTGVTGTGFALLSLNLGTEPVCAGYTPPSNEWFEFHLTVAGDKTVQAFYSKAAMKNVAGPSALQICFAAPTNFAAQNGTAAFDYDGDPANGDEGFVGLLPIGCPLDPAGPVRRRAATARPAAARS